ncbi:MAG: hypothetical protein AAGA26_11930 [Pseudomonadota bacterium]
MAARITDALGGMACEADPDDVIEHEGHYEVMLAICADGDFFIEFDGDLTVVKKIEQ